MFGFYGCLVFIGFFKRILCVGFWIFMEWEWLGRVSVWWLLVELCVMENVVCWVEFWFLKSNFVDFWIVYFCVFRSGVKGFRVVGFFSGIVFFIFLFLLRFKLGVWFLFLRMDDFIYFLFVWVVFSVWFLNWKYYFVNFLSFNLLFFV